MDERMMNNEGIDGWMGAGCRAGGGAAGVFMGDGRRRRERLKA